MTDDFSCAACGNTEGLVFFEYDWRTPEHYDGISEILCFKCGPLPGPPTRTGRWSRRILKLGDVEPPFGRKQHP